MIGDKLIIGDHHRKAAGQVFDLISGDMKTLGDRFVISVAGESGSGKSEIAFVLAEKLKGSGIESLVLGQDDYFVFPPKTNAEKRCEEITRVGTGEVRLDKLDENLRDFLERQAEIVKPLVVFEEDRIVEETLDVSEARVVIVEGTYTTLLTNVQIHVFIDRNYIDTKSARGERSREAQDVFLEEILKIEHGIISASRARANIIIDKNYGARKC